MKQKIILFFCLCLMIFLLLHPQDALAAAKDGLSLWLNVMIPTLLPFLILTGILLKTGNIQKLLRPLSPAGKILLGLSPAGLYVLILGLLCGYPMGAKLAHDLYIEQQISRREGEYLLTFSCNASPAFILSYLSRDCLDERIPPDKIIGLLLAADVFCMLFFRFFVYRGHTVNPVKPKKRKKETSQQDSAGAILDVSIMNGFETITRLGGYILMFSLIFAGISYYWPFKPLTGILLTAPIELTTGLHRIALTELPWKIQYCSSMMLTAFGGLCIMAQTKSVLQNSLSLLPYIISKCLNAAVVLLILVLSDIL
ncbi:hypothetical protein WMO28_09785 [Blautia sp. CLA-JM-H16]|uniref:Sporulation integral membrane protein YlbJ n=1 Tax=Blautia aquisgranensis TaxID=3133153 RepID=A0ABV1BHH4_9FIRM